MASCSNNLTHFGKILTLTFGQRYRHLGHWMRIYGLYLGTKYEVCRWYSLLDKPVLWFLSHKIKFCDSMFSSISTKNKFFLRNQEILCFLCVLDPGDHFTKSRPASGVRRPASGVLRTKLGRKKFQSQIISKPFDRSPSYLVWWCKKIIDI